MPEDASGQDDREPPAQKADPLGADPGLVAQGVPLAGDDGAGDRVARIRLVEDGRSEPVDGPGARPAAAGQL